MSQIIDAPAAYAAGLIDGEGCIRIIKYTNVTYKVVVQVKMCDIEGIRFLYDHFGGNLSVIKSTNPKHNDADMWMLHGKKACTFLNRIMGYLQVKRKRAEIAVLCGETTEYSQVHVVPSEVIDFRKKCFDELKRLNARGTSAAETNREDSLLTEEEGCDSPNLTDGKREELPRNVEVEHIDGEYV
jgi:hypothetical protein